MNKFNFQRLTVLVGIVLVSAASSVVGQSTIYKAGTVHTMQGDAISPAQILVVDGKIKAVAKTFAEDETADVVDLGSDSVVLPGFIDAYSQAAILAGSTDEFTEEVTPKFMAANALDWSRKELKRVRENGTTTMNVCPGTQNVIGGKSTIIKTDSDAKLVLKKDGFLVGCMCNDPASRNRSRSRPDSIYVRQPTNRMGVVWILRNTFNKSKTADRDSKLNPIRQTLGGNQKLMLVSRMSFDLNTVGTLADEFGFSPIIIGGDECYKIKSIMAKRKYPIVLRPQPPGQTRGSEGSELCWNNAGVLEEAGIPFALSGANLLELARFAHRHGCSREKALAAITTVPAGILGIKDQVGSIAPGKAADMVVLNGDPLELTTAIQGVVINGKMIKN